MLGEKNQKRYEHSIRTFKGHFWLHLGSELPKRANIGTIVT